MLRLVTQWLAAQALHSVKEQAIRSAFSSLGEPETKTELAEPLSANHHVDVGFVFAMPMEAAGIVDRLKQKKTTRGDGRVFHAGIFAGRRVVVVESGVGQEKAAAATEALIGVFAPKRILSAGYAGGLLKRLKQFTVCIPEVLVRSSDGRRLDLSHPVPQHFAEDGHSVENKLALLTVDRVIATPTEKNTLGQTTGAELVDMETFAVAEVCRRHAVPFLSIRIILDAAEEELPKDVQRILKHAETGGARLVGSLLGSLVARPKAMLDLLSLKQRALNATDRLAKHIEAELETQCE